MTGPEHFKKAEECIKKAFGSWGDQPEPEGQRIWLAQAQVHATLALAAATAVEYTRSSDGRIAEEWYAVID